MIVNPVNVATLLLAAFQSLNIEKSPVNHKEMELKDHIEDILLHAMNDFNGIEMIVEESLDFHEQFKDLESQIVEDEIQHFLPDSPTSPTDECTDDEEALSYDYKLRALEYWRSGKKKNLSIENVKNRFKKVKSARQLRSWALTKNKGGTYKEKIARICDITLQNFKSAVDSGFIMHDMDLRKWALRARAEIGHEDFRFAASRKWLQRFKNKHRIVSRKINKFVTRKTLENGEELQRKADHFVADVKQDTQNIGIQNVYNSDQSGFNLEIHSGRTLADQGLKKIECVVQSTSSTTHSYTVQPLISAEGKLLSPLFLVLKEPSGKFGPSVEKNVFRPNNVHIEASKSGKLTSDHFRTWLKNVYFPNVGPDSILLLDSWSGHCPRVVVEVTPANKNVNFKIIPTGTTGKIQPLDVFGFRIWKNFVRHFSDCVVLMNYDINLHLRNNIIKLQSLVHNQLSSPRYTNMFKYSWYKSGYIAEKPDAFDNPVDFCFGDSTEAHCQIEGCTNVGVIRCSWCKKTLCLKHFFDDYHYCSAFKG